MYSRALLDARMNLSSALVVAASLLCGCTGLTELVVVVDTDLLPPDEVDLIRIDVEGLGRQPVVGAQLPSTPLPVTLGLVHEGGPLGPISITAIAYENFDEVVVERRARVFFVEDSVRLLQINLLRSCVDVTCPEGETCGEQGCRPIEIDPTELEPWTEPPPPIVADGGVDAMVDAPPMDAPMDTITPTDAPTDAAPDATAPACPLTVAYIGLGWNHACVIDGSKRLYCWGSNAVDQLGLGPDVDLDTSRPIRVGTHSDWERVTGGTNHTCGTRAGGQLFCWGRGGVGSSSRASVPTAVMPSATFSDVATGLGFSCAVQSTGALWCFGNNGLGALGQGDTVTRADPVQVGTATDWRSVAAGYGHVCAVRTDGSLYCWGHNTNSQLGLGDREVHLSPTRVGSGSDWRQIAAGSISTCGIRGADSLFCWGSGEGTTISAAAGPGVVGGTWESVMVHGGWHTCAFDTSMAPHCWGRNSSGQLGLGDVGPRATPTPLGFPATQLGVGQTFSCATDDTGALYCWGGNDNGQLGVGDTLMRTSPTRVCP